MNMEFPFYCETLKIFHATQSFMAHAVHAYSPSYLSILDPANGLQVPLTLIRSTTVSGMSWSVSCIAGKASRPSMIWKQHSLRRGSSFRTIILWTQSISSDKDAETFYRLKEDTSNISVKYVIVLRKKRIIITNQNWIIIKAFLFLLFVFRYV